MDPQGPRSAAVVAACNVEEQALHLRRHLDYARPGGRSSQRASDFVRRRKWRRKEGAVGGACTRPNGPPYIGILAYVSCEHGCSEHGPHAPAMHWHVLGSDHLICPPVLLLQA